MVRADLAPSVVATGEREIAALMGGRGRLVVVAPGDADAGHVDTLLTDAEHFLRLLESRWSRFLATSEVSALNRAQGQPTQVSGETATLVAAMVSAWHLTEGVVNSALLREVVAAGYAASVLDPSCITVVPGEANDGGCLSDVTCDMDRGVVQLPVGLALDPGGVGKGLAADLVVERLLERGAIGAMVEVGGDLRCAGVAPQGGAWFIDIADPHQVGVPLAQARVADAGIATSSVLRRRWVAPDGSVRHHLMGRDGHAVHHGLATSSAAVATGALAEVMAKLPLLLGETEGLDLLDEWGIPALVVRHDGVVVVTRHWQEIAA